MTIETTSVATSKKLAPILARGISFLIHARQVSWDEKTKCEFEVIPRGTATVGIWEFHPAFTACELMKVLPLYVELRKLQDGWVVEANDGDFYKNGFETPAEALGNLVVWLHGEGLLK